MPCPAVVAAAPGVAAAARFVQALQQLPALQQQLHSRRLPHVQPPLLHCVSETGYWLHCCLLTPD
jgi:hypothetical protein